MHYHMKIAQMRSIKTELIVSNINREIKFETTSDRNTHETGKIPREREKSKQNYRVEPYNFHAQRRAFVKRRR